MALQLWRRDATRAFERVHFGDEPVHSLVLDAWFIPEARILHISDDRKGTKRWLLDRERLALMTTEAERANADEIICQLLAEKGSVAVQLCRGPVSREALQCADGLLLLVCHHYSFAESGE